MVAIAAMAKTALADSEAQVLKELSEKTELAPWFHGVVSTLRPQMEKLGLPIEKLENLDTLVNRMEAEVTG